jgi:DNA modification methylase
MTAYYQDNAVTILNADCREALAGLPSGSVQTCITSPPYYGLRDYGHDGQIGLEQSPDAYVANLVAVFREVKRVLRDDGTLWLNLGDSYNNRVAAKRSSHQRGLGFDSDDLRKSWVELRAEGRTRMSCFDGGLKEKDLIGIPWMVAFALRADGWYLRADVVWNKPNPMPESVRDRPTKSHEYLFLLAKSADYYYDAEAIREPLAESTTSDPRYGKATKRDVDKAADRFGDGTSASRRAAGSYFVGAAPGRNRRSVWTITTKPFKGGKSIVRRVPVAAGDADDDTKRTPSPDCPVHADRDRSGANARGDGRATASAVSRRSPGSGSHPGQERLLDSVPIAPPRAGDSADGSSDSPLPSHAPSANGHSTGSHKTAHDLATTAPCSASARTSGRTGDTSAAPATGEPPNCTNASRSAEDSSPDGRESDPPERTAAHIARTDTCTCSYYREITESVSHFAVMPPDLVEPCVLAGTSARGQCATCGAPWERVVERTAMVVVPSERRTEAHAAGAGRGRTSTSGTMVPAPSSKTTGWKPSCAHGGEPVPQTVLDPFGGAATVGLVARNHGRRAVLVELNPAYCEIAADRLKQQVLPLFPEAVA